MSNINDTDDSNNNLADDSDLLRLGKTVEICKNAKIGKMHALKVRAPVR